MACVGGAHQVLSIDTSTWNDAQIEEAWSVTSEPYPPTHAVTVYGASKAEAEKAFWKYVKEENPHFKVNTILPDENLGEVLSLKGSLSTGRWVRGAYENDIDLLTSIPPRKSLAPYRGLIVQD